jgi:hypothetical protein
MYLFDNAYYKRLVKSILSRYLRVVTASRGKITGGSQMKASEEHSSWYQTEQTDQASEERQNHPQQEGTGALTDLLSALG